MKLKAPTSHHSIFGVEWWYFATIPAWVIGVIVLLIGLGLVGVDIQTTHIGAYNFIMGWSSTLNQKSVQYQSNQQVFAYFMATIPPALFFVMLFRIGRHYSTREAQVTSSVHGLDKSIGSDGGDFMLYLFAHFNHWLPIVLGLFGIGTTMAGFMGYWAPDTVDKWWGALVGATIIACIVYALGPQFILLGFHFFHSGKREQRVQQNIDQGTTSSSDATIGAPPARREISGPSHVSQTPVQRLNGNPGYQQKGLPSPKAKDVLLQAVQQAQQKEEDDPITGEWESLPGYELSSPAKMRKAQA